MAPQRRPGAVDSRCLARSPGALSGRAASTTATVAERSDGTAKRRRGRGNSEQAGGGDRPGHRAYSLDARPAACGLRLAAGVQAPCSPAEPAPRGASIGGRQTEDGGRRTRADRAGTALRSARRSRRAPRRLLIAEALKIRDDLRHHGVRRAPAASAGVVEPQLRRSRERLPATRRALDHLTHDTPTTSAGSAPNPLTPCSCHSCARAIARLAIGCGVGSAGKRPRKSLCERYADPWLIRHQSRNSSSVIAFPSAWLAIDH